MSSSSLVFSSLNMPVMKDDKDTLAIRKLANDIVTDLNQLGAAITSTSSASVTAGNIITPLPARPSGNVTYAVPSTSGIYQIYIPSSYLVATSGGPFTLTLNTSKNAASVVVPIGAYGNTISSGNLFFNVYVDASGNVTTDAWEISGSNSNGSYEQRSNGNMTCTGWAYVIGAVNPVIVTAITMPGNFISSPNIGSNITGVKATSGGIPTGPYDVTNTYFTNGPFSCDIERGAGDGINTFYMVWRYNTGSGSTSYYMIGSYIAQGRWRT